MIFLRGDLHAGQAGELKYLNKEIHPELYYCTKQDYLIILGDFGFIWGNKRNPRELKELYDFKFKYPWTTLFLPGNHENYDRLYSDEFEEIEMFGDKVKVIYDDVYMLQYGRCYTIEGKTFFVVPGAESIDKEYRIENVSWWKQEQMNYSQWREVFDKAEELKSVDYILAHDIPESVFYYLISDPTFGTLKKISSTSKGLQSLIEKLEYKQGFSGHYHVDKHFPDMKWEILYNGITQLT